MRSGSCEMKPHIHPSRQACHYDDDNDNDKVQILLRHYGRAIVRDPSTQVARSEDLSGVNHPPQATTDSSQQVSKGWRG